MTVTAFGSLFLSIALLLVLFKRAWLLPWLCVAAVLQSPSVVNVHYADSSYGVTPFVTMALLLALGASGQIRRLHWRRLDQQCRRLGLLWAAFAGISLAGSFLLPMAMHGTLVVSPLLKSAGPTATSELAWGASNAAQAANLSLVVALAAWLLIWRGDALLGRKMLYGVGSALLLSVLVGLHQRLAWNGLVPMGESLWASNPTYAQNYQMWAGTVPRVSWPFVESSYASAWFAGVYGGFLATYLFARRSHLSLAAALLSLFGLANTLGATGLLSAAAITVIALLAALVVGIRSRPSRHTLAYRMALATVVLATCGLGVFLVMRHYQLLGALRDALAQTLLGQPSSFIGDWRPEMDRAAVELMVDSWGLGVGMGSNRASSYLATLASNTGVLGVIAFLAAFAYQCVLLTRRAMEGSAFAPLFFLGSGCAALLAVAIAIPDQNWPVLWILILGGWACVVTDGNPGESRADGAQETRRLEAHDAAV